MRGFLIQNMAGKKTGAGSGLGGIPLGNFDSTTPGAGSYTMPVSGTAHIFVYGAGGGGGLGYSPVNWGGAGAGACYKAVQLAKGAVISFNIGTPGAASASYVPTPGGNTTCSGPGFNMTAYGPSQGAAGEPGGSATGGDINRRGGASSQCTGVGVNGQPSPDPGGGDVGLGSYNPGSGWIYSAGGSGAGFGDFLPLAKGGDGGNAAVGKPPGGGGCGSGGGNAGGAGRVLILVIGAR